MRVMCIQSGETVDLCKSGILRSLKNLQFSYNQVKLLNLGLGGWFILQLYKLQNFYSAFYFIAFGLCG